MRKTWHLESSKSKRRNLLVALCFIEQHRKISKEAKHHSHLSKIKIQLKNSYKLSLKDMYMGTCDVAVVMNFVMFLYCWVLFHKGFQCCFCASNVSCFCALVLCTLFHMYLCTTLKVFHWTWLLSRKSRLFKFLFLQKKIDSCNCGLVVVGWTFVFIIFFNSLSICL